jgi:predicted amidohydrolase YtcJ
VVKDLNGNPTGELREIEAMALVGPIMAGGSHEALVRATRDAARLAQRAGCTTISDWAFGGLSGAFQAYQTVAEDAACPVDIVLAPFYRYLLARGGGDMAEGVKVHGQLQSEAHGRLKVGPVKLMVDGSIQGFTGDLKWPGYYNGAVNHLENTSLAELTSLLRVIHGAGLQATIHTNGDGASEKALVALQRVLTESPRPGHRHRLEHLQMVTRSQLETMAALDVAGNIFPVHIYYWGDFHRSQTLGPDRARRMDSAAAAKRAGVRVSFHSDAPVTPVGPLFSAWCATARETSSGFVLGPEHRIPVEDALAAITIEAAYLLHEEADKGSIETGKLADFTVVDRDPLEAGAPALRDINVVATVKEGRVFEASNVAV